MNLGTNLVQTHAGNVSIYSILKSNNIVYTTVEELNTPKYFYIYKKTYLVNPIQLVELDKVYFCGKKPCVELIFENSVRYLLHEEQEINVCNNNKSFWVKARNLSNEFTILSIKGTDVGSTKLIQKKFIGYRPLWALLSKTPYYIMSNGIIIKAYNEQRNY